MSDSPTAEYSLEQRLAVCLQVARLVRAKLPIAGQLSLAAKESSAGVSELARAVDQSISQGKQLASALADDPSVDSRILAACIEAGESADCLDEALYSWAGMHIANARAHKTMRTALIYPAMLILVTIVSLGFVVWTLIPQYQQTYELFEHELPSWLAAIVWVREQFGLLIVVLLALALIPLVFWYLRRRGRDKSGQPRETGSRQRLQALCADMAARMLDQQLPLIRIVELCVKIGGGSAAAAEQAFSSLRAQRPLPPLTSETSMLLAAVHSGLMEAGDAADNLRAVTVHLRQRADIDAAAQARWIPMLVALTVGFITISTYVFLIYLPWIWLLREIVDADLPTRL